MARKIKPVGPGPATATVQGGSVSRENAEHYRWGNDCDAWYLVKDPQLSVIEEFMPPGAAEIRHHHERARSSSTFWRARFSWK
jgi:hypothetical protein